MSDQRLADEAARRRRQLREEQDRHTATCQALREANRTLLRVVLRDHLEDPTDFEIIVPGGLNAVSDDSGRLVWSRVGLLLQELLEQRPHLAATRRAHAEDLKWDALAWLASEQHPA